MDLNMNRDPKWIERMAKLEAEAGSVSVPFQGNFFLCGEEGLYQLSKPHQHPTQESANDCTLRWGVQMALRNEKLLKAAQSAMKFIKTKAPKNYAQMKTYQELEAALGRKPSGHKKCGVVAEISGAVCDLEPDHLICVCGFKDMHSGIRPDGLGRSDWFNK